MEKTNRHIIEVKNLSYHMKQQALLTEVSLSVHEGESIAIVGANGAGKTTLIKCLLGLLASENGSIALQGKGLSNYTRAEIAQQLSYVPQQLPENIVFTVTEFIMMSRYTYAAQPSKNIALEIIDQLGIRHLAHQPVSTLSGGERQKVNLAAALAQETPIIVLDEPTSQLDPKQRDTIQRLLTEISQTKTTLAITHDLNWAAHHYDRLIGMKDGKIVTDTSAADFLITENLQSIFDTQLEILPHPHTGKPMVL